MPPAGLSLSSTLIGSNYSCLELIFMVPKVFEPLKFDCNSHKSVQKLFHNLHIIFPNSLMGFKVICQLETEPLKGLANVQEIFS